MAHPSLRSYLSKSLRLCLIKEFRTEIAVSHKGELLLKRLLTLLQSLVKNIRVTSG